MMLLASGRTWCAKNEKRPTACPGAPLVEKCSRWQVARANQSASEHRASVYWTYTTKRLQIIRRVIIKLLRMSKTTHWLVSVKSVTKQNEKKKRCMRALFTIFLNFPRLCAHADRINHANCQCHASDDINKWIWSTS